MSSFKEKYLKLREKFDQVSSAKRHYTGELDSALTKVRRLKDEKNHLLDVLSDIQRQNGTGPTSESDTSMDEDDDQDEDRDHRDGRHRRQESRQSQFSNSSHHHHRQHSNNSINNNKNSGTGSINNAGSGHNNNGNDSSHHHLRSHQPQQQYHGSTSNNYGSTVFGGNTSNNNNSTHDAGNSLNTFGSNNGGSNGHGSNTNSNVHGRSHTKPYPKPYPRQDFHESNSLQINPSAGARSGTNRFRVRSTSEAAETGDVGGNNISNIGDEAAGSGAATGGVSATGTGAGTGGTPQKQTRKATKRADRGRPRHVVPLATNPDGTLKLPAVVGRGTNEVIIESMGKVVYNGRGYHNHRYIFPVGFRSKKQYPSLSDTSKKTYFISEILDGGDQPIFQISLEDMPEKVFQHSSSSGAWELALRGLMEQGFNAKTHASGPDMYGLTNLGVVKWIQEMPGANRCRRYMPLNFITDENADAAATSGSSGLPTGKGARATSRGATSTLTTSSLALTAGSSSQGGQSQSVPHQQQSPSFSSKHRRSSSEIHYHHQQQQQQQQHEMDIHLDDDEHGHEHDDMSHDHHRHGHGHGHGHGQEHESMDYQQEFNEPSFNNNSNNHDTTPFHQRDAHDPRYHPQKQPPPPLQSRTSSSSTVSSSSRQDPVHHHLPQQQPQHAQQGHQSLNTLIQPLAPSTLTATATMPTNTPQGTFATTSSSSSTPSPSLSSKSSSTIKSTLPPTPSYPIPSRQGDSLTPQQYSPHTQLPPPKQPQPLASTSPQPPVVVPRPPGRPRKHPLTAEQTAALIAGQKPYTPRKYTKHKANAAAAAAAAALAAATASTTAGTTAATATATLPASQGVVIATTTTSSRAPNPSPLALRSSALSSEERDYHGHLPLNSQQSPSTHHGLQQPQLQPSQPDRLYSHRGQGAQQPGEYDFGDESVRRQDDMSVDKGYSTTPMASSGPTGATTRKSAGRTTREHSASMMEM